ncbi:hypothetical protein LINGRAHAP2_LOCUS10127, partial [Linum grandiflorum]
LSHSETSRVLSSRFRAISLTVGGRQSDKRMAGVATVKRRR